MEKRETGMSKRKKICQNSKMFIKTGKSYKITVIFECFGCASTRGVGVSPTPPMGHYCRISL